MYADLDLYIKYNGDFSLLVAFELTFLFPVALELLTTIVLVDLGISAAISWGCWNFTL